jgi:hypothetical protein
LQSVAVLDQVEEVASVVISAVHFEAGVVWGHWLSLVKSISPFVERSAFISMVLQEAGD